MIEFQDYSFSLMGAGAVTPTARGHVSDGQIISLLGPSGCGKSTFLRTVAGLQAHVSGSLLIDQQPIESLAPYQRKVGLMFQQPLFMPSLSVWRNVAVGLNFQPWARGLGREEQRRLAAQALDDLRVGSLAEKRPDQCSGGEQQRISLARTLIVKPRVLLLDEPFSALDPVLRKELGEQLKDKVRREQIPCIFVTHDYSEAERISDKIVTWPTNSLLLF